MVPSFVPNTSTRIKMESLMNNKIIRKAIETGGHLLIAIPVGTITSFHVVTVNSVGKLYPYKLNNQKKLHKIGVLLCRIRMLQPKAWRATNCATPSYFVILSGWSYYPKPMSKPSVGALAPFLALSVAPTVPLWNSFALFVSGIAFGFWDLCGMKFCILKVLPTRSTPSFRCFYRRKRLGNCAA